MIVIVGAGALGSHVAMLSRNWEQPIRVVDFDVVEQKNVQAQFHTKMGLRRNKAKALQQALQGMFGTKIEAIPHKLTQDNSQTLLEGAKLVIDCTDNIEARQVIQAAVRDYAGERGTIPCVHGALSADGTFARVIWDEHFVPDPESGDGATCEDGEHLPFIVTVAALLASISQAFLKTGARHSVQLTPTGLIRLA